jgi:hypothetical protein
MSRVFFGSRECLRYSTSLRLTWRVRKKYSTRTSSASASANSTPEDGVAESVSYLEGIFLDEDESDPGASALVIRTRSLVEARSCCRVCRAGVPSPGGAYGDLLHPLAIDLGYPANPPVDHPQIVGDLIEARRESLPSVLGVHAPFGVGASTPETPRPKFTDHQRLVASRVAMDQDLAVVSVPDR